MMNSNHLNQFQIKSGASNRNQILCYQIKPSHVIQSSFKSDHDLDLPITACYYNIGQLRCIRPYLDFKIASIPLPLPPFTPNLIIMAAVCNRGPLYFCPVISFYLLLLFSSPNLSGRRLDVHHTTHGVALVRI